MLDRRLAAWLAAIYVACGVPMGLVTEALPIYLRQQGTGLAAIGAFSLTQVPWSLKPLWAPWVDRHGTARRWIGGALMGVAVALAALAGALGDAGGSTLAIMAACTALTVAAATQDLAVDGYFVRQVPAAAVGTANGLRVGAYRAGMILGGGTVLLLAARVGWRAAILALTAVVLAQAVAVRWLPLEREQPAAPLSAWLQGLWRWAERDGSLGVGAFLLLYRLGDAMMAPMVRPFWVDRGLTPAQIWLATTVLGMGCTVVGALCGGLYTSRAGIMRGLVVLGGLQAVSNLGYAAVGACDASTPALLAAVALESLCQGLGVAAQLALVTRLCDSEHAATQFAALSALLAVTRSLAGALSGVAADAVGLTAYFAWTFVAALPAFALLPQVARRLRALPARA